MNIIEKIKAKIRGTLDLDKLKKEGLVAGENFNVMEGCIIDPGHCWLIEIGNNVTLAPRVHILAHDASTKKALGYTKIKRVVIGDNVFVGAGTIILPGVRIGSNVIIGAGSVVTKNLEDNGVFAGNPCGFLTTYDNYINKEKKDLEKSVKYDKSYVIGSITNEKKRQMVKDLNISKGYIV